MAINSYTPPSPPPDVKFKLIYDGSTAPKAAAAQLPCTISSTLLQAGIPLETAQPLLTQFNRVSFPIISDQAFAAILIDVFAKSTAEQFAEKVKERIGRTNSELDQRFKSVGYTILDQLFSEDLSDQHRSDTINLVALGSLNGVKSFIVSTLPRMVAALKKEMLPEANTGCAEVTCNTRITRSKAKSNTQSPIAASRGKPRTPPSLRNRRKSGRIAKQNLPEIPEIPKNTQKIKKRPRRKK